MFVCMVVLIYRYPSRDLQKIIQDIVHYLSI